MSYKWNICVQIIMNTCPVARKLYSYNQHTHTNTDHHFVNFSRARAPAVLIMHVHTPTHHYIMNANHAATCEQSIFHGEAALIFPDACSQVCMVGFVISDGSF